MQSVLNRGQAVPNFPKRVGGRTGLAEKLVVDWKERIEQIGNAKVLGVLERLLGTHRLGGKIRQTDNAAPSRHRYRIKLQPGSMQCQQRSGHQGTVRSAAPENQYSLPHLARS